MHEMQSNGMIDDFSISFQSQNCLKQLLAIRRPIVFM